MRDTTKDDVTLQDIKSFTVLPPPLSFHHSFHGRTTGSVKLTGNPHYQEAFGPLIEGVRYATLNDIESVKA